MHLDQLRTLVAVVDHGTLEAAARELHLTPSAVSQRLKALEADAGQVLLVRGTPCVATAAGQVVLRAARQIALLESEARATLGDSDSGRSWLPVAVNADSLATWFVDVLPTVATWADVALRVEVEDQGHSHELLRRGDVVGAVTSDPRPVAGCRVIPLGVMRYLPVAAPGLIEAHRGGHSGRRGRTGRVWSRLPTVRFNAKDDLQHDFLAARGVEAPVLTALVPSSEGFAAAVRAGLGWGLLPEAQVGRSIADGTLVRLAREQVDVALHWQVWSLRSERVERLTTAVRDTARVALRRGGVNAR